MYLAKHAIVAQTSSLTCHHTACNQNEHPQYNPLHPSQVTIQRGICWYWSAAGALQCACEMWWITSEISQLVYGVHDKTFSSSGAARLRSVIARLTRFERENNNSESLVVIWMANETCRMIAGQVGLNGQRWLHAISLYYIGDHHRGPRAWFWLAFWRSEMSPQGL